MAMQTRDKKVEAAMTALRGRAQGGTGDAERLGRILSGAREIAALTIREVSEACGISEGTISRVERAQHVPNSATVLALVRAYRERCDFGVLDGRVWVSPR